MGTAAAVAAITYLGYQAAGSPNNPVSEDQEAAAIYDGDGNQVADLPPESPQEVAQDQLAQSEQMLEEQRNQTEQNEGTAAFRAAKEAQDRRRRQIAGMYGRSDTILTNPLGQTGNGGGGQRKTLLGE